MIDLEELRHIVKSEAEQALNYSDATFSDERIKATEYYHGEPFGNEEVGRSQVVSRDLADVVDHMMPQLMRIFATSDYVKFAPRGPEDVAMADQATDLANYIVETENHGFRLLHDWFKDALLNKVGVIKAYWDERQRVEEKSFEGLSETELQALIADDTVDIVEQEIKVVAEAQIEPMSGVQLSPEIAEYDVTIKRRVTEGAVKLDLVPPEEFLIDTRAKSLNDARFVAHRTMVTVSDLVAMGYDRDEIERHAGGQDDRHAQERQTRFQDLDGGLENDPADDALREVVYTECWLRVDADEDGIAETRRVCTIGDGYHPVRNEYADVPPFALLSPILMPHRAIGQSIAEKLFDVQLTKSALLRQTLDNIYLTNNSRVMALEGATNLDDLMTSRPGGIVRVRQMGAVQPLTVPQVGRDAMAVINYMDEVKEQRTGISKAAMGLDANALQSTTAAAVSATVSAAQSQIEMIARVFAETGVKDLFRIILRLIIQYQERPKIIRLRNEFVPIDPRGWNPELDVIVNVGLGTGQTQERMAFLGQVAAKQEQILQTLGPQNPLVSLEQYAHTLEKMIEMSGFKATEAFVNRPAQVAQMVQQMTAQAAQSGPVPDKDFQKFQMDSEIKRLELKAKSAQAERDAVQRAELDERQMQQQAEIERFKAELNAEAERQRQERQMVLDRERMEREFRYKMAELEAEKELERLKMQAGSRDGQGNINLSD